MLKNLYIVAIVLLMGLIYYKLSIAKNDFLKNYAFFMKIFLLILSFILEFVKQDYIAVGGLVFGGRTSVMMLVLIEIVDAFVDKKDKK